MLKNVNFKNFRNKNGVQELSGFDCFIGPNGTGKSSVVDAIQLAITGKINSFSQPKDIINNANGDSFSVGLETSEGFVVSREYKKKIRKTKDKDTEEEIKNTVFSQKIDISTTTKNTNAEKEMIIEEKLGVVPMAFDFSSFSGLNSSGRKDYLSSYLNQESTFQKKDMFDYLEKVLEKEKMDKKSFYNSFEPLYKKAEEKDILGKAKEITQIAKENISYLKKEENRLKMSVEKMTEQMTEFDVNGSDLKLEKEKVNKLTEDLISLEKKKVVIESNNKKILDNNKKFEAIKKEIEEIKNLKEEDISLIQKELKDIEDNLEKVIKYQKIVSENVNSLSKRYKDDEEDVNKLRLLSNNIREEGTKLRVELDTSIKLLQEVENTKGCCKINASIPCNADFSKWISAKKKDIEKQKVILNKKVEEFKSINNALIQKEKEFKEISSQREHYIAKQSAGAIKNNELSNKKIELSTKLEKNKNFSSLKEEKLKAKEKELSLLNNDTKIEETEDLQSKILELKKNIEESKNLISKKEQIKVLQTQIKSLNSEYDTTKDKLNFYKFVSLYMGTKGLQAEILKKLVEPFVEEINSNLSLLGFNNKFFIKTLDDNEKEIFDFGVDNIFFDNLSKGQQLMLATAIVTSFVGNSNQPIKYICIDNLNELDYINIKNILNGLKLIKEKYSIDNIILSGCVEISEEDGYKVWNLA